MKAMVRSFSILAGAGLLLFFGSCATKKPLPPQEEAAQTTVKPDAEVSSLEQLANFYENQEAVLNTQNALANSSEVLPPPVGKEWHVGKIMVVNQASRFALVDSRIGRRPPKGALLVTKNPEGQILTRMTTSPETGREFVAADLVEGLPVVGDAVYWIAEKKSEASNKTRNITN